MFTFSWQYETQQILMYALLLQQPPIVKPVSHLHITFTIPKILRAYFRRNRKLLKFLVQSANWTIEKYFTGATEIEGGYTGGIYCIHSQGSLFNYHPHLHALVPAGIM